MTYIFLKPHLFTDLAEITIIKNSPPTLIRLNEKIKIHHCPFPLFIPKKIPNNSVIVCFYHHNLGKNCTFVQRLMAQQIQNSLSKMKTKKKKKNSTRTINFFGNSIFQHASFYQKRKKKIVEKNEKKKKHRGKQNSLLILLS